VLSILDGSLLPQFRAKDGGRLSGGAYKEGLAARIPGHISAVRYCTTCMYFVPGAVCIDCM
jgi:hypothetical protein